MRIIGIILIVVGYIIGMITVSLFGVLPVIGRFWSWDEYGLGLILGFVGALLLCTIGTWLRNKAKKNTDQS